ncbi:NUDIX domain-containing protein [Mesobacillus subterraneus]|uniref:NUDIX domain-containing protein n=1 Tax=Mesobacillus subterraneus TaxID=285983 RepID=A0A427TWH2_9BACI|nr:NUDIX domain-containing protein [Mesobacillus subterraneus]
MTKHVCPDKTFWTLPGGGLEKGESFEEAVVRAVKEEVGLDVDVVEHLFTGQYPGGEERCFLVRLLNDQEPSLGFAPELGSHQTLTEVEMAPARTNEGRPACNPGFRSFENNSLSSYREIRIRQFALLVTYFSSAHDFRSPIGLIGDLFFSIQRFLGNHRLYW